MELKNKYLDENLLKYQKILNIFEEEKMLLESSFKNKINQNEIAHAALGNQIDLCKELEEKYETQIKIFLNRSQFIFPNFLISK